MGSCPDTDTDPKQFHTKRENRVVHPRVQFLPQSKRIAVAGTMQFTLRMKSYLVIFPAPLETCKNSLEIIVRLHSELNISLTCSLGTTCSQPLEQFRGNLGQVSL